jgi:hypothetical protein
MRTLSRLLLTFLLASLVPTQALAMGTLTANDSIAGLGASIELRGFAASDVLEVIVRIPDGMEVPLPVRTDATGAGVARLSPSDTEVAGIYRARVEKGGATLSAETSFEVLADTVEADNASVKAVPSRIETDGFDEAVVTVTLMDRFGNPLPGRPVTLISGRSSDQISPIDTETDGNGEQRFAVSTTQAGLIQVRAVDLLSGISVGSEAEIQAGMSTAMGSPYAPAAQPYPPAYPTYYPPAYQPYPTYAPPAGRQMYYGSPYAAQTAGFDVIDHFEIDAPDEMAVGDEAPKISIRAVDRSGQTVEDYIGSILFSSTDAEAILPNFGRYTFRDRDLGEKSFPLVLKFSSPGEQMLRVEDANDPRIFGETSVEVTGAGGSSGQRGIEITSHSDGDTVNVLSIQIEGTGPKFANLIVQGGAQDADGSTDEDGKFSVPITLKATQRDFTIRVRDETGRYDSGPIQLILDTEAPVIGDVGFFPEEINENEQVLATVTSEPGLQQVVMQLTDPETRAGQEIPLIENPTASGSYQGFFNAPRRGQYQPVIVAMDRAGNVTEVRAVLTVGVKALPTVENVRVSSRTNAVALEWDAVESDIDGYRIYVGDSPTNFLYNLDTGRVTTKATVAGLSSGKAYYFAVTALKEDIESKEKSEVVEARTLGLTLQVQPQEASLLLQWTLASETPLSSYLLEYGVQEGVYTERRLLNGELKAFTLRDLLSGITYHVRLTPVTVTGDKLDELSAIDKAIPTGSGLFRATPADPIPFDPASPPGNVKTPPPASPTTGIPPVALWAAITAAIIGFGLYLHRRKTLRQSHAFLQAIQSQYRG